MTTDAVRQTAVAAVNAWIRDNMTITDDENHTKMVNAFKIADTPTIRPGEDSAVATVKVRPIELRLGFDDSGGIDQSTAFTSPASVLSHV